MKTIKEALDHRFGDFGQQVAPELEQSAFLRDLASRGVCRRFRDDPVPRSLIETLSALALSAPSKSDLQQRDILIVDDPAIRSRINTLLADQDWIPKAPHFIVFLGNNRRQRQVHGWTGLPFANDHLDAFFNASVDAGIVLSAFVLAAEAAGLGCCPVSVIRNHAQGERYARSAKSRLPSGGARIRVAARAEPYQSPPAPRRDRTQQSI